MMPGGPMSFAPGKRMGAGPMDIGRTQLGRQDPPNLRDAEGEGMECGVCAHYQDGSCARYGGYPVESEQICDSFEEMPEKLGPTSTDPYEMEAE